MEDLFKTPGRFVLNMYEINSYKKRIHSQGAVRLLYCENQVTVKLWLGYREVVVLLSTGSRKYQIRLLLY